MIQIDALSTALEIENRLNEMDDLGYHIAMRDVEGQSKDPRSIRYLLNQCYDRTAGLPPNPTELFRFRCEESGFTVYNPVPVMIDRVLHLWGREEPEGIIVKDTKVKLYVQSLEDGQWDQVEGAPVFDNMQDPFYCGVIDGWHIMGGVQTYPVENSPHPGYRTVFYRYRDSIKELIKDGKTVEPYAQGPEGMKGVRLVQLAPGRIGVFVRPQGEFGGRGRIGYYEISSLDKDVLQDSLAKYLEDKDPDSLIKGLFLGTEWGDEEWGGPNQVIAMKDGRIFVLGHIAGFMGQARLKVYFPMTFIFDPRDKSISEYQIISSDLGYPRMVSKFPQLGKARYPGGFAMIARGILGLIQGIGDLVSAKEALNPQLAILVDQFVNAPWTMNSSLA